MVLLEEPDPRAVGGSGQTHPRSRGTPFWTRELNSKQGNESTNKVRFKMIRTGDRTEPGMWWRVVRSWKAFPRR